MSSFTRHAGLLVLPSLLLVAGPLTVLLATDAAADERVSPGLIAAAGCAVLPLLTPLALRLVGRRWDPLLLSPVWVLCALGLTVVARVQPTSLTEQVLWIAIGWCAFVVVVGMPPLMRWLLRYRNVLLAAALLLVLSTLVLADDVTGQGARLWLRAGPLTIQPAEVLRVLLLAFLAGYLATRVPGEANEASPTGETSGRPNGRDDDRAALRQAAVLLGIVGLSVSVVVAQGDFGPALVFAASSIAMFYLAATRRSHVLGALALFLVLGLGALALSDRLQGRVDIWLDPWADPHGAGYQPLQAIGGFVFGGVTGTGPGWGYPGLVPAAHTDYPLAALGEEWGLLGALAVILLYGLLVARGLARAQLATDPFARLLGAGLVLSLGLQVLLVLGGVLRLLPLTGVTSPFLSYGGSSMVMSWIVLALLLRVGGRGEERLAPPMAQLVSAARVQHLGFAVLAGFVVLAGALGYWQVLRADDLASDPAVSGQRLRLEAARITRGSILDRNGEVLAETVLGPDGTPERRYTLPSAVHVVGFDSPVLGTSGAEALAADLLMGREQRSPLDTFRDLLHEDRAGADVRLTIDARLQQLAASAMGDAPGAVVALDPRSGDILALVSNPTYLASELSEDQWQLLREDPASPLLDRATQGLYPPGSTFKTVTLAAALEAGLVEPDTPAECPAEIRVEGVPITSNNEPPGRSTQTVADAYAYSCNTYFAQLGVELGGQRLVAMAEALGLTEAVPLGLPTSAGRLSTSEGFLASDAGRAVTAFGQGELQLTPLHLALVAAAVANDGVVPRPRLFLDDAPATWRRAMSSSTAHTLALMMEYSVDEGWAAPSAIPGVRVGGKTGSAEVLADEPSHALFIAFAPLEDPSIAVAVVKERAGAGSTQAGPVARDLIAAWLEMTSEGE